MPEPIAPPARRKISADAILIAGAGLLGVILLMRSNRSATAQVAAGYAPVPNAPIDPSALEQGIISDPAFWAALSQQQALQAPPQSAPVGPPAGPTNPGSPMPAPVPKPAVPDPRPTLPVTLPGMGLTPISGQAVAVVQQPGGGEDIVTNQGAVYAIGGAGYYGGTNPGSIGAGWHAGTIIGAAPLAGGGYALFNQLGQSYNFGPLPGQDHP